MRVLGSLLARMRPVARDLVSVAAAWSSITAPAGRARGRLTVVTFHRVLPASQRAQYPLPGLAVTPEELSWLLQYFRAHYSCGPLAAMQARWRAGERPALPFLAITFDDGQWDNFAHARPVLRQAGVTASFYVPATLIEDRGLLWHDRMSFAVLAAARARGAGAVAAALGQEGEGHDPVALAEQATTTAKALSPEARAFRLQLVESLAGDAPPAWARLMTWEELAILVAEGDEVGSHTLTHPLLPQSTDDEVEREVIDSRGLIESRLGVPVRTFCYPNGDWDGRSLAAVRRAGYECAVTTGAGLNDLMSDRLRLRRIDMRSEHLLDRRGSPSVARLAFRLSGLREEHGYARV